MNDGAETERSKTPVPFSLFDRLLLWRPLVPFFQWLNQSPRSPLHTIQQQVQVAASCDIPVLILGETGVGKEVLARKLHNSSQRKNSPFVAVNCGSLTASLLESSLFGSVRGAYTGAHADSLGFIRAAEKGSLFLDEIGELPLEAQSRLLRVLQERKVVPVGGYKEIAVDFRLICATHRNLRQAVRSGLFRADLFYRINVFTLEVPPLRQRTQDIVPLAHHLWNAIVEDFGWAEQKFPFPAEEALCKLSWPGNVRQLRNFLERCAVLQKCGISCMDLIQKEELQPELSVCEPKTTKYHPRPVWNVQVLSSALEKHQHNQSATARHLGVSRGSLSYQMRKFGLR